MEAGAQFVSCQFLASDLPDSFNVYTIMHVTYDPAKRELNIVKHGIDLVDCEAIFDAPMLTREDIRFEYDEERLISLGLLRARVVVLIWTDRDDGPRLISCREANRYEQEAYFRAYPRF